MYADKMTDSMVAAIEETNRRRDIQLKYNDDNGIIPTTVIKDIQRPIRAIDDTLGEIASTISAKAPRSEIDARVKQLDRQMREAAKQFDFETAAKIRDIMFELKSEYNIK